MSADFFDSNIFVYLFDETDDRKQAIAGQLVDKAVATRSGVISFQVVQETLNVVTGKLAVPASPAQAKQFLDRVLLPLWRVMPSGGLYRSAIDLRDGYGFGFYDSLIVAAAVEAGCNKLYTEDLQHGQRIGALTIDNPFAQT